MVYFMQVEAALAAQEARAQWWYAEKGWLSVRSQNELAIPSGPFDGAQLKPEGGPQFDLIRSAKWMIVAKSNLEEFRECGKALIGRYPRLLIGWPYFYRIEAMD